MKHKKKVIAAAIAGIISAEIIVGDLDWWRIEDEEKEVVLDAAASSLYLSLSGSRCSGVVLGPGLVLTNHHCIGEGIGKFKVTADFDASTPRHEMKWFECEKVLWSNQFLDYSVAECPDLELPSVSVNIDTIEQDMEVFLVHQNCDWKTDPFCKPTKVVSYGQVKAINNSKLRHSADTLGGSSGSPIFDQEGNLTGIHNSGYGDFQGDGRGIENGGIVARKIVEDLPSEITDKINLVGDISTLQPNFSSGKDISSPKIRYIKKKSFKCRYFSWLFKRSCK